jgi:hypothetical protein
MNIIEQKLFDAEIESILSDYAPITLPELEADHLMSRFDAKYVFHSSRLKSFLSALKNDYKVLAVNNTRRSQYENIYFDTLNFKSYHDHHNARANRYKIRFRRYSSSGDCFLELNEEQNTFLARTSGNSGLELLPSLSNRFFRITLVNEINRERLTLDSEIGFKNDFREKDWGGIAIAEVKQEQHYYDSAFKKLMQRERIFPVNISKYCMGMSLTHPGLKYNRFKSKLITLNKICDGIA